MQEFNKDVIKPFIDLFNYKKQIKELEKDKKELHNYINKLQDKINYKKQIIYNPNGKNYFIELSDNLIYIQGKPKWIPLYIAKDVFIVNEKDIDKEWFEISIKPNIR